MNQFKTVSELGDIFTSLTADEAVAVSTDLSAGTGTVTWYTVQNTTDNKLFNVTAAPAVDGLKQISDNGKVLFYATKEDALANGLEYDEDVAIKLTAGTNADVDASTIRKIAYAVIPFSAIKNNALPDAMTPLTLVLKDKDENEIRKASGTYAITLPAFDDILDINKTQKLWNEAGDTYSTRFDWDDTNNGLKISMQKPFVSKKDVNETAYFDVNDADSKLYYELSYTDFDKKDQLVQVTNDDLTTLTGKIVKDGELMHEIEVEATLYPFGKANQENLKLTKTFKLYVQSVFEGAKLVYYDADVAQEVVTFGNDQYIEQGYKSSGKKYGLYVQFDGEERPYVFKGTPTNKWTVFNNETWILDSKIVANKAASITTGISNDDVKPSIYLGDGALTVTLSLGAAGTLTGDALHFNNVPGSTSGTVIFNFVDGMGVQIPITVSYKK